MKRHKILFQALAAAMLVVSCSEYDDSSLWKQVDEAQKQARVMVDQSEVSRRAEEEATKLISSARSKAADAARQATQYADTMLSNLEDFLNTELGDVKKSRENLTSKRGN